jgi:hypothetical protein
MSEMSECMHEREIGSLRIGRRGQGSKPVEEAHRKGKKRESRGEKREEEHKQSPYGDLICAKEGELLLCLRKIFFSGSFCTSAPSSSLFLSCNTLHTLSL